MNVKVYKLFVFYQATLWFAICWPDKMIDHDKRIKKEIMLG